MEGQVVAQAAVYAPAVNIYGGASRWTSSASAPMTSFLSDGIYSPPDKYLRTTSFPVGVPGLVLVVNNSARNLNGNIVTVTIPKKETINPSVPTSFKHDLERVQQKLSLSITQLAELLGVTRKSVYDWFDGTDPRNAKNRNRMGAVLAVMDARQDLNLARLKGVWNMPVSGRSFLSILGNEDIPDIERQAALIAKLDELAPRLGAPAAPKKAAYLGSSHLSDLDRTSDLG